MSVLDIAILLSLILFPSIMYHIATRDWLKTDKRFVVKKLIDCIIPFISYSYLVYLHSFLIKAGLGDMAFWILLPGTVMLIWSQISFCIFGVGLFSKASFQQMKGSWVPLSLLSKFIVLLIAGSMINYMVYIAWPAMYALPPNLNHFATGFEFIYYTFSVVLTYGGNSIEAVHVLSKLIEILEISVCYVLIGVYFADLIEKAKAARTAISQ